MSSSFFRVVSIVVLSALAVAACTNEATPSATGAPVPGDLGPGPTSTNGASELPGPRADDAPASQSGPARPPGKGGAESLKLDPAKMDPTTFVAKAHCLMPKLSMCSAYGEKYERLTAVPQFCAALGGEQATSCPTEGRVAHCITPANVISSYYSSGGKPYTKESGEAKCNEKKWMVLP